MFNKLLKITVIGFIWTRYGRVIASTLMLFAYFWVVSLVHQDYLDYLKLQANAGGAGLSFILKWLAFIAGIVAFWIFNNRSWRKSVRQSNEGSTFPVKPNASKLPSKKGGNSNVDVDPFESIRRKDKLRSRADLIIEKNDD